MSVQFYEGIGRRKDSTARVRIMKGSGKFVVNTKPIEEYFTRFGDMNSIVAPFSAVGEDRNHYDISVVVSGGGVTGQTFAVQLGLARALITTTRLPLLTPGVNSGLSFPNSTDAIRLASRPRFWSLASTKTHARLISFSLG